MRLIPNVGIIRGIVWWIIPSIGFGYHAAWPGVFDASYTLQIMWLNRGLAFDWTVTQINQSNKG